VDLYRIVPLYLRHTGGALMKKVLLLMLLLQPIAIVAQLATPSFGLTQYPTGSTTAVRITYATPQSMAMIGPTGATICMGVNMTPTASVAGTCDATAGEFTYSAAFMTLGTANYSTIATQAGQTNSPVGTLTVTIPTFSYPAGPYSFNPVVTVYPDYFHSGGTICGSYTGTPTESGNVCTGSSFTITSPVTITTSETLYVLFTKSGQTDTTASAAYVITSAQTWFVRPDGGTYQDANVPAGECNGKYDVAYSSGVSPNCAVNDVRYLWADNSGNPNAWVISGGDTVVIRGCTALSSQTNPANPYCRLGYDNNNNGNPPNSWCGYGNPNSTCYNPPIPMGSAAQPTKILGQCAYGTYTCTPITNYYPYATHNETQLFGGFGLTWTFNLNSTNYVTIEGIELTTHNGTCTSTVSANQYPTGCNSGIPYSDHASDGFWFNESSSNIVMQDVYIHGFDSSGLAGPIGGAITMTRVFDGFNGFAGWNFDDGHGTNDATGSSITANYVTMDFNGCYEQYPIVNTYPAQVCYDLATGGGFGDSWSGQGVGTESVMSSFTCNYCVSMYNTKDGFIGPHIAIPTLTITNSVEIGNEGSNWKWGGEDGVPMTLTFTNNLTVNNCLRMSAPITGAPANYNQFLGDFCRAGGNGMALEMPTGSTWNISNNTFVSADSIAMYVACSNVADTTCPATINATNNVFLGYTDPTYPVSVTTTLYYFCNYNATTCTNGNGSQPPDIALNPSHNSEFGMRSGSGTCPTSSYGMICTDPKLLNEPAQPWPGAEGDLDVFDPFVAGNSFYPTSTSPLLGAGTTYSGIPSTDYYGVPTTSPDPVVGAVNYVTIAVVPYFYGGTMLGGVIH
jgi:hypothetical protein